MPNATITPTYWDNPAIATQLSDLGLSTREHVEATRRLSWDSWGNRCIALAEALDVDASELAPYVWSLVRKAPDLNGNGWDYRQELASHIVTTLLAEAKRTRGNWELVKVSASCAYRHWYRDYSQRQTANKLLQSVSLEREEWDTDKLLFGAQLVRWESETDSRMDLLATFKSLPDRVRDILEKKLAKVTLLPGERKHLSRWLQNTRKVASNGEILRARLAGYAGAWALDWGKAAR